MKTEEMKTLSEHLIDAINREDLTTRQAAEYLGLNPGYISMAKNPKLWDSMSKEAWYRLTFWHNSQCKLSEYKIVEDAEVYQPKEKADKKTEQKDTPVPPEFPPDRKELKTDPSKPEKKEKQGKSVKLVINQAELDELREKIRFMENDFKEMVKINQSNNEEFYSQIEGLKKKDDARGSQIMELYKMLDIQGKAIKEMGDDIPSFKTIQTIIIKIDELEKAAKPTGILKIPELQKPGIVIFQRNIYPK